MLLTPGPVEVPCSIMAFDGSLVHHRSKAFSDFYASVITRLEKLSGADNAVVLTGSGTLANEAMLSSLDLGNVLVVSNGVFGKRLEKIASIYNPTDLLEFDDGIGINFERIKSKTELENYDCIAIVENETSTSVKNDVSSIARNFSGKVIADSVSTWPVSEIRANEVPMFTAAVQKAIGIMPGLSIVFLNDEMAEKIMLNPNEKNYYANLKNYLNIYKEKKQTPFTPAITLLQALGKSLDTINEIGARNFSEHHRIVSQKVRSKLAEMGFELMAENGFYSDTVTGFVCKNTAQKDHIKSGLEKIGFSIAGGKGKFSEIGLRIGTMGFFDEEKIFECLEKIELLNNNFSVLRA
ncbi:MAG: aminotransferase class V-fold PLP-dependent enzyme [archaeon]|nr:aminotransferase class V-fold PLP-dependent enzyme [archaeon]